MNLPLERFLLKAEQAPSAVFIYDDAHQNGVTYHQAEELSGRVYAWLKDRDIGKEDFVLINLPRGVLPFLAAIGVWRAGAAFVIVEEHYSPERVAFIRKDCACRAEVNQAALAEILRYEPLRGREETDPHDAAFAIYTSGTTGTPKGVLHEYGNLELCARSLRIKGNPLLGREVFRPFTASQSFVAAIIGLIGVMTADFARMYIVPYSTVKNPEAFIRLFEEYRFNTLFLSPSYARVLGPMVQKYLKTLVLGSERDCGIHFPGVDVYNFYASSESLFLISAFKIDRIYDSAPVGRPTSLLDVRLLREDGREAAEGEVGEVVYQTPYVRGYIRLPEETAEAFSGGYYHSGDLGRLNEDGNLVILGRKNDMVKINGNRVEPGEIESVAQKVLGVDWAAARVFSEPGEEAAVCVYYTADISPDTEDVRKRMMAYLPYYMIPTHLIHVDRVPLLPNGKMDRKALPKPTAEDFRRAYTPPENETERALCRGFEKVLALEKIGAEEDFYELGGDSLRSIRLVLESGLEGLNVGEVFKGRTPRKIAALYLKAHPEGLLDPEEENRKALSRPHRLTTEQLYMLDYQLYTPKSTMYNLFALFRLDRRAVEAKRLSEAVETVLQAHPSLLTTLFFDEDGEVLQRYSPETFTPLQVEKLSETELEALKDTLVQPYRLMGKPLYRCRVFETEKNVYLFLDVHHMVFDGRSFRVLMEDISAVYAGGAPRPDFYYRMLEKRQQAERSTLYQESRKYFEDLYEGTDWSAYPPFDHESRDNTAGECALPLPAERAGTERAEQRYHLTRNELFIGLALLTLAAYNDKDDVYVSWIYNGREERRLTTTTGLLFRELPAGVHVDRSQGASAFFADVRERVQDGIGHSCYPYVDNFFSDMASGNICVLYQQDLRDPMEINGALLEHVPIRQNRAASQTILDIQVLDGVRGMSLLLDYTATLYEESTIMRFGRLMRAILGQILKEDGQNERPLGRLLEAALADVRTEDR